MLHWGRGRPDGPPDVAGSDPSDRPEIEVTSLPDVAPVPGHDIAAARIERPVPLVAELPAVDTPRVAIVDTAGTSRPIAVAAPAEPVLTVEETAPEDTAALPVTEAPAPAPPPETEPDPALAVARSAIPRPRPLRLTAPEPEAEIVADTPPRPEIELTAVEPTAMALAVEKALAPLEETETPVTLAVVEALADAPPVTAETLYVTGSRVNLRAAPDTDAGVVLRLDKGDAAELLARIGNGWLRIRDIATGEEGFMSADYLSADMPG
ncbi:SH3 domain-containing protein [Psychromarinibacter sp. C21-152]|uniref:SH3 domain-containing protein n=1 Tax=Psychromarinibacter sediminicola TaxID=3033385 RepID=A0AAE3NRM3_9RHOB|nr:SH3 domain-containing protein [Psychromarinibacter sediminicola]MDF0600791.1 SH3 domain-containing protein [Psychromarinibacter sediminicola]